MALAGTPHKFEAGKPEKAAQVNDNFAHIEKQIIGDAGINVTYKYNILTLDHSHKHSI